MVESQFIFPRHRLFVAEGCLELLKSKVPFFVLTAYFLGKMPLWSGKFKSCADTPSRDSAGTAETVPLHRLRASDEGCFSLPGDLSVPSTLPSSLALTPGPPEVRVTAQVVLLPSPGP